MENIDATTEEIKEVQDVDSKGVMKYTEDLRQGAENARKVGKIAMEAAAAQRERTTEFVKSGFDRQNAEKDSVASEETGDVATRSKLPVRQMAKNGTERFLQGQDELIDLGRKQSRLLLNGLEELSRFKFSGLARSFGRISRQAVLNVFETQERLNELNSDYVKTNRELAADSNPTYVRSLSEFAGNSAEIAIDASKQILDIAKEQTEDTFKRFSSEDDAAIDADHERDAWLDRADAGFERISEGQKATVRFARELSDRAFAN